MRALRKVLPWVLGILLVAASIGAYLVYKKRTDVPAPKYRTTKVEHGSVSAKVTATGTLSARVTVQVGSQVSGRVQDLFADFNSQVKKGQVVAKLDPRLYQAALNRARASASQARGQLERSKANLAQAERNLDRMTKLRAESLATEAELESARSAAEVARADVSVSRAQVESAGASLLEAQVNLGFTTIVSPIDGIVLSRSVDVGQTVAASLSAPVLFTIAQDLRNIQVDTFVAEADVGRLKQGMEATFTVDAYPGQKFKGTVREVRNASQTVQNVVTYDAVLDVVNEDLRLKPGMTANVTFVWAESKDVLVVPNAALRFRPPADAVPSASGSAGRGAWGAGSRRRPTDGAPRGEGARGPGGEGQDARKTIWLLRNGALVPRRVEIGVTDGSITSIVGRDLEEGDEVVVDVASPDGAPKPTQGGGMPGGNQRGGRLF